MNKFVFIGIIALLLGTAGVLIMSSDKTELPASNNQTSEQRKQAEEILSQYTGGGGTYERVDSSSLYSKLSDTKPGEKDVLFFEGRTCPSCKQLDKNIRAVQVPDHVHIFNILYEDNLDLVQKYQVRGTPGLYQVDTEGNVIRQLQPVLQLDNILLQLI